MSNNHPDHAVVFMSVTDDATPVMQPLEGWRDLRKGNYLLYTNADHDAVPKSKEEAAALLRLACDHMGVVNDELKALLARAPQQAPCKYCGNTGWQMNDSGGMIPCVHTPAKMPQTTQATTCAGCGKYKPTPLRVDAMGGYVCLTCIDQKLCSLLGEFGYPEPQPAQANVANVGSDVIEKACALIAIVNRQCGGFTSGPGWDAFCASIALQGALDQATQAAVPVEWRNALREAMDFANNPPEGHDEGMLFVDLNERVEKLLAAANQPQDAGKGK